MHSRIRRHIHTHPLAPAQHDVQVYVSNRELITHKVVLTVEHVFRDVLELLIQLVDLHCLVLSTQWAEQRAEVCMHLRGHIVESHLGQISVGGAIGSRNRSWCLSINQTKYAVKHLHRQVHRWTNITDYST